MSTGGATAVTWLRSNGANNIAQARVRPAGGAFAAVVDLSAAGADAAEPECGDRWPGPCDDDLAPVRPPRVEVPHSRRRGRWRRRQRLGRCRVGSFPALALDASNNAVAVWTGGNLTKAASRPSRWQLRGAPDDLLARRFQRAPEGGNRRAGNTIALWSQSLLTLQASRRPPGGSFGGVEPPLRGVPATAIAPNIAFDEQGNAVVAWASGEAVGTIARSCRSPRSTRSLRSSRTCRCRAPAPRAPPWLRRGRGRSLERRDITWNFGDGGTASGPSQSHAYAAAGVYTVTVSATDGAGNSSTTQRTIQVSDPPPPPTRALKPAASTMTRTGSSPARTATTATRRSGPARSRSGATTSTRTATGSPSRSRR